MRKPRTVRQSGLTFSSLGSPQWAKQRLNRMECQDDHWPVVPPGPRLLRNSPHSSPGRVFAHTFCFSARKGRAGPLFKEGTRRCEPATGHRDFLPEPEGQGPGKVTCSLRSTCDWLSSGGQGQRSQTLALTSCVTLGKGTSSLRLHFLICRVRSTAPVWGLLMK